MVHAGLAGVRLSSSHPGRGESDRAAQLLERPVHRPVDAELVRHTAWLTPETTPRDLLATQQEDSSAWGVVEVRRGTVTLQRADGVRMSESTMPVVPGVAHHIAEASHDAELRLCTYRRVERTWASPERLIVRPPSPAFARALSSHGGALDPVAAVAQHAVYVRTLEGLGHDVTVLPASPHPDGCFVEDPVVVLGPEVVRCQSAVVSRRGEGAPLIEALGLPVFELPAQATLDGGDVLRVGDRLLVGLSARTNQVAVEALRRRCVRHGIAVHGIVVPRGLHLKSACALAAPDWLLYDPTVLSPETLAPAGVACTPADEPLGANVLALGAVTLVSAGAPRTAARIATRRPVHSLALPALHAADGALTCLSVRVPATGTWVT